LPGNERGFSKKIMSKIPLPPPGNKRRDARDSGRGQGEGKTMHSREVLDVQF
jgi:hypothetical protein